MNSCLYEAEAENAPENRHSSPCRGATMVEHRVHIAGVIGLSPIRTTRIRLSRGGFFCCRTCYVFAHLFLSISYLEKDDDGFFLYIYGFSVI